MALPTKVAVQDAIAVLEDVATEDKTAVGAQNVWRQLKDLASSIENFDATYNKLAQVPTRWWSTTAGSPLNEIDLDVSLTDATDATLLAALAAAGEIGVAAGGVETPVGTRFRVDSANDTTDNALAGVKGSAVVANDVFQVYATSVVIYLGTFADL